MFNNDRLNKILKNYLKKKSEIPAYNEFNESVREEKRQKDHVKLVEDIKTDFENLSKTFANKLDQISKEIFAAIYPNITKENSVSGEKTFGAIEFRNALETFRLKPANIEGVIHTALNQKRIDFVSFTLDFYLNDETLSQGDRIKIESLHDEISEKLGVSNKENEQKQLEIFKAEVMDFWNLLVESPEKFEAEISKSIRVASAMKEAGQLADSVLL